MSKEMKDGNPSNRSRWFLLCFLIPLFGLAVFIRLEYLKHTEVETPIRADAYQYYAYGYNLRHFGIFSLNTDPAKLIPDSFRSPGYPFLIATLIFFMGDTGFYQLILYIQCILSSLLAILTFLLGLRLLPRWAAMIASLCVAFSPHLISMQSYLLSETLFAFLLLLATVGFYEALRDQKYVYSIGAGLLYGAAYLTNETIFLLPPFLVATALLVCRYRVSSAQRPLLMKRLVAFLLVFYLVPFWWLYRSSQLPNNALKGSKRAIVTLSHGAYPGFVHKDPAYKNYPYLEDPQQPEFGRSFNSFIRILWKRFKQRPARYISWYMFEKPYYLWSWDNLQSYQGEEVPKGCGDVYFYPVKTSLFMQSKLAERSRQIVKCLHPIVLLLAFLSVPLVFGRVRHSAIDQSLFNTPVFMTAIVVYFTLVYTIFAPWPRYSVPLRPELYLCAVWSAAEIGKRISAGIKRRNAVKNTPGV